MCGRYTLKVDTKQVAQRFHVPAQNISGDVAPHYNVAPSQLNPVITLNGEPQLELMQWGLVPSWSKEPKTNYSTINARVETITTSSVYRKPLRHQRCLVPATGFYEWQAVGTGGTRTAKQPFYFQLDENGHEGELFAFAGLYDIWQNENGEKLKTYTIITTAANDLVQPVHERMPVILPREWEQRWLDPELTDADELLKLLKPFPAQLMAAYPVSKAVNTPANDSQELIAPLAQ